MNMEILQRITVLLCLVMTAIAGKPQMISGSFIMANYDDMQYVLAVPNSRFENGQNLILWEFHDSYKDQKFKVKKNSDNSVSIIPEQATSKVLAIPEGRIAQNVPVILWHNNYGPEQKWILEHVSGMIYVVRSYLNRNYVLAAEGSAHNNSSVVIQSYTGADNQQWMISSVNGDAYLIYGLGYDKDLE